MTNNNLTDERLSALIRVARDSLELYEMELPVIDDVMIALAELQQRRAAMLQSFGNSEQLNSPVIPDDVRRMDWLVSKTVNVREPLVYGSHNILWSQAITDEQDDHHATKLREQIDAAMAAENAAAPQQEVTQALAKGMERYGDAMRELAKKEEK